MGTWGIKLFSNDTTCDVRDTYIELLKKQYSDEDAEQKTYEEYEELMGTDEEPLFWLALAHTQWKNGRLSSMVKDKALAWIDVNGGAELFEENKRIYDRWLKYLVELKVMLLSHMPKRKVYREPKKFERNLWNLGDVYAYQFHTKKAEEYGLLNKFILFHKVGNVTYFDEERYAVVEIYNKVFDKVPILEEVGEVQVLPLVPPPGVNGLPDTIAEYVPSFEYYLRNILIYDKRNSYPREYFHYIGNVLVGEEIDSDGRFDSIFMERNGMEEWLCCFYQSWKEADILC